MPQEPPLEVEEADQKLHGKSDPFERREHERINHPMSFRAARGFYVATTKRTTFSWSFCDSTALLQKRRENLSLPTILRLDVLLRGEKAIKSEWGVETR
ncbi:hypothetical protein SKAU_G00315990 [Synaphobranchus kaupii]|uniref:Uncharacterized protein n=1 Tax=Synaphobranchus kaupii TaxID=118154 RepID=A0A9Q1ESL8_SYNKA|nr:hypothetical protein SKAU_G00315990 [Synaphobranchus kaupii]